MSRERLPLAEVERQVAETKASPKRLPASWREPGVALRMALWLDRFGPEQRYSTADLRSPRK